MTDQGPLPPIDIEAIWKKFYSWNGEAPAPFISHRTADGTLRVEMSIPLKTVKVFWNGRFLGHDDYMLGYVARNISLGRYDHDAGVKLSEIIPPSPADWNGF